jgi:hypothetical protein
MSENGRPMTYGERAVGLDFNPGGDPDVAKLKQLYAQIIDFCDELRTRADWSNATRLYTIAIDTTMSAQMWAVKAATWK